jgi:hypothetical protein
MRQIDFQSAGPPPARALPLKKWDFGTSRLAALIMRACQHTSPSMLAEGAERSPNTPRGVARNPVGDLFLCAKHLFGAAMV